MVQVSAFVAPEEQHVPVLMSFLLSKVRRALADREWDGLRQSHAKVLGAVPTEGVTVTELARRVGMTKQGCGQFVAQLDRAGLVSVTAPDGDRRTRIVRRTEAGHRVARQITQAYLALEQEWAQWVGPRRYATFRRVLEQLADGDWDEEPSSDRSPDLPPSRPPGTPRGAGAPRHG
ncbi:MAG: winged helix-turn-helix transcriptional regulator [Kineosporiaceae bacterium]|nr:winged helix-turn-helix transcriptional regulator [Kineosporiaceae bacterium]